MELNAQAVDTPKNRALLGRFLVGLDRIRNQPVVVGNNGRLTVLREVKKGSCGSLGAAGVLKNFFGPRLLRQSQVVLMLCYPMGRA